METKSRFRDRGTITPRPAQITNGVERGLAFRNWLDVNKMSITGLAKAAGISRNSLIEYLNGVVDIAYISQERAEGIITAMNVTDWEAWEIIGIPEDAQPTFRSFRPAPWGHGLAPSTLPTYELKTPMAGEQPLPANVVIHVDPNNYDKIQVIRLEDGRFYSVTALLVDRIDGERLGGLVRVDY